MTDNTQSIFKHILHPKMVTNLNKLHNSGGDEGYPVPTMLFAEQKSNGNKGMKKLHGVNRILVKETSVTPVIEIGSEANPQTGYVEFLGFGAYDGSGDRYLKIELDGNEVFLFDDYFYDEYGIIPIGVMAGAGAGVSMSCVPFNKSLKVSVMNYDSWDTTAVYHKLVLL